MKKKPKKTHAALTQTENLDTNIERDKAHTETWIFLFAVLKNLVTTFLFGV